MFLVQGYIFKKMHGSQVHLWKIFDIAVLSNPSLYDIFLHFLKTTLVILWDISILKTLPF